MESRNPDSPTGPQLYCRLRDALVVVIGSSSLSSIAHEGTKLDRRLDDGSSVNSSGAMEVL